MFSHSAIACADAPCKACIQSRRSLDISQIFKRAEVSSRSVHDSRMASPRSDHLATSLACIRRFSGLGRFSAFQFG